jgi:hypothetical protein
VSHRVSSGAGIESALSPMQWLTLALRGVMETGIVVGLAFWGAQTGSSTIEKVALAIGAPALLFGFWGLVDFRQAGRAAEPLRLVQELAISGLAALAVWAAGQPLLGALLALVSIVYHVLVYVTGGRLLKADPPARTGTR